MSSAIGTLLSARAYQRTERIDKVVSLDAENTPTGFLLLITAKTPTDALWETPILKPQEGMSGY
jgi:hypothetical protein